ncbi:MAG: hypothetical protein M3159_03340 [Actinomycetota bacterium]|nr:hypothetical protein [Actinomycetota bacterium]
MSLWCPSCRREISSGKVTCPTCLVDLVDDLDATIHCGHCNRDWPAWMQSCPHCLGELHSDPARTAEAIERVLAAGLHMARPDGVAPFESGPDCTLLRVAPRSNLVFTGPEGFLEATVHSRDRMALPPLSCQDFDGAILFGLSCYEAAPHALVAVDADGAPLGTYLRVGGALDIAIDVRDETSAPVARLVRSPETGDFKLVQTGGGIVGVCTSDDDESDGWIDDQWSLQQTTDRLPLQRLGAVGLVLAAKVLLGRPSPERRGVERDGAE